MSFGVLLRQVFVKNIVHLRLRESKLKVVLYLQELKIFYYSEVTCKKVTGLRQCLPAWRGGGHEYAKAGRHRYMLEQFGNSKELKEGPNPLTYPTV